MTARVPVSPSTAEPYRADAGFRHGMVSRLAAEAFGTLFLVVAGLGVPLFTLPQSNPLPAALAGGLAVTASMLAFAHVSGGHFNPAITLGHLVAGRLRTGYAAAYVVAQLAGAAAGALALYGILRTVPSIPDTKAAFDTVTAGFGEHSVVQTSMAGVLLAEVLGAALLVAVFLGATARGNVHAAAAPFAVGLSLAVLLQFGQAIGNAPYNPARATASALFSNSWSVGQLWLFWVAPLVGAAIAGLVFRAASAVGDGEVAAGNAAGVSPAGGSDRGGLDDDGGSDANHIKGGSDANAGGSDDDHVKGGSDGPDSDASGSHAAAKTRPAVPGDEARDFFDGSGDK
ncbi:MIP/aquaporin family protein [Arthrobacter sp. NPDC093125]|uniref:MIP/aquaporin family protein n=1 Tax=Arthrobacter sp. NPDC093125 TaxID=3363944 RepID=UPI003815CBA8